MEIAGKPENAPQLHEVVHCDHPELGMFAPANTATPSGNRKGILSSLNMPAILQTHAVRCIIVR